MALEKLYRYASGHVFESEVAGKMCADMCAAATKVDPSSTLKQFLPYCLETVETILTGAWVDIVLVPQCLVSASNIVALRTDPEQLEAEHPDHNLLWNLQLLSKVGFSIKL